jgi:hypothetical protein
MSSNLSLAPHSAATIPVSIYEPGLLLPWHYLVLWYLNFLVRTYEELSNVPWTGNIMPSAIYRARNDVDDLARSCLAALTAIK